MQEDFEGAYTYAMRDPELTVLWHHVFNALAGLNDAGRPFITTGSAGLHKLLETFGNMGIDPMEFFGKRVVKIPNYKKLKPTYAMKDGVRMRKRGVVTDKKIVPIMDKVRMAAFEASVTGGRNMVSHFGPTPPGPSTENDVKSAYVVAKCDIREPHRKPAMPAPMRRSLPLIR